MIDHPDKPGDDGGERRVQINSAQSIPAYDFHGFLASPALDTRECIALGLAGFGRLGGGRSYAAHMAPSGEAIDDGSGARTSRQR